MHTDLPSVVGLGEGGGLRLCISNQLPGDATAAGPHHTWSSKALAFDCLYIKMLPLNLLSQSFFAFLCSWFLGICLMSLICYYGSAVSSRGSMSYVHTVTSPST